jgi:hypothetical protein
MSCSIHRSISGIDDEYENENEYEYENENENEFELMRVN